MSICKGEIVSVTDILYNNIRRKVSSLMHLPWSSHTILAVKNYNIEVKTSKKKQKFKSWLLC